MTKYKALVTGASGLLGRAVLEEFKKYPEKWAVTGLAYSRAGENMIKVDLRSEKEVEEILNDIKPHVVLHCAAERRPNIAEHNEELTKKLNVQATSQLAKITDKLGCYLIYISTDYVFDGTSPPYKPGDQTNPLNKYGQSKLDGEKVTLQLSSNAAVLRVPILYGAVEKLEESAVTCLFELVKSKKDASVSDYEIRQPTHVNDVASVCRKMCDLQLERKGACSGTFHWGANEGMTKYKMVQIMGEVFDMSTEHIKGFNEPSPGAKRPFNCNLDCSDLKDLGIQAQTPFKEGIKSCLQPFL